MQLRIIIAALLAVGASAWAPDFVVYNADFDYRSSEGNPDEWVASFEDYFGPDMPLFASIGNHDSRHWFEGSVTGLGRAWETVLAERYARLNQTAHCSGTIGISNVCSYKGLLLVEQVLMFPRIRVSSSC